MSSAHTLSSRLRVLVAKAHRAEKLYSSIRNTASDRAREVGSIVELANDLRAREWQQAHQELRVALNSLLSAESKDSLNRQIETLLRTFEERARESDAMVQQGIEGLIESARHQEFAHTAKAALELLRQRARGQASAVIAEELGVLTDSGRRAPLKVHELAEEDVVSSGPSADNVIRLPVRSAGRRG